VKDIVPGTAVRDGNDLGIQQSYQSTIYYANANWDTFVGVFETGRSRPITSYTLSAFDIETNVRVAGPQSVTSAGEQIVSESVPVNFPYLTHNRRYYSVVNATLCPAISRISPGFLVDTTLPIVGQVRTMTDLWLVGGDFTFEWDGISDPESGIDYLQLWFYDEENHVLLSQSCKVFTSESFGSANVSWADCGAGSLPPVTPLSIRLDVFNRAGGFRTISNNTRFQVAGIRITDVISYNGLSSTREFYCIPPTSTHFVFLWFLDITCLFFFVAWCVSPEFKQCRRAIVEWVSIGLNETFVMPSLYGTSLLNMSDTPIPIEANRFEMEPVSWNH